MEKFCLLLSVVFVCSDFLPRLSQTQSRFLSRTAWLRVEKFGLSLLSVPLLRNARDKLKVDRSNRPAACHHVASAAHLLMFPADAHWLEILKA